MAIVSEGSCGAGVGGLKVERTIKFECPNCACSFKIKLEPQEVALEFAYDNSEPKSDGREEVKV